MRTLYQGNSSFEHLSTHLPDICHLSPRFVGGGREDGGKGTEGQALGLMPVPPPSLWALQQ